MKLYRVIASFDYEADSIDDAYQQAFNELDRNALLCIESIECWDDRLKPRERRSSILKPGVDHAEDDRGE